MIFCRDGIKIGLENKFYGKCFPAYHAAGGHFLRNRLMQKQADGTREKYTKTERFPLHRTHKVFFEEKVLL